jgi:hypothetical protein
MYWKSWLGALQCKTRRWRIFSKIFVQNPQTPRAARGYFSAVRSFGWGSGALGFGLFASGVLWSTVQGEPTDQSRSNEFFQETALGDAAERVPVPELKRSRALPINPAFRPEPPGRFVLNLFPDYSVPIVLTEARPEIDSQIWTGRIDNEPDSQFSLARYQGTFAGTLRSRAGVFQITAAGNGRYEIAELNSGAYLRCDPTRPLFPARALTQIAKAAVTSVREQTKVFRRPGPGEVSVVSLMVLYTRPARDGAGGTNGINALIDLAMAEARQVLANSQVQLQLRLVYRGEIAYTESGNLSTDLSRLQDTNDGLLDAAHSLRDQYQADAVCLLVERSVSSENSLFKGVAYAPPIYSDQYSDFAFSVVQRRWATGDHTFIHEVGHNFGCHHDREYAGTSGVIFPYAYGHKYRVGDITYATVMSYGGVTIPYFSNPNISYRGAPTGVPEGEPNPADNARTINRTSGILSAYRGSEAITLPPEVEIVSPVSGTKIVGPTNVIIQVDAYDLDGQLTRLDFYQGALLLGSLTNNFGSFTWRNAPLGSYTLTVVATDNLGAVRTSLPVPLLIDIPRPANDSFAQRLVLEGTAISLVSTNQDATKEPGEPNHAGPAGGKSVWWSWTPAVSGPVTITTANSSFDTLLAVYTGSNVSNLTAVASNNNESATLATSRVMFDALAQTTYAIAVDGFGARAGTVRLSLNQVVPLFGRFQSILRLPNGAVELKMIGTAQHTFRLENSSDLIHWQLLQESTFGEAPVTYTDSRSSALPRQFYRLRISP